MATEKKKSEKSEKSEKSAAAASTAACSVKDCKRPYRAKGLCVTHYKLWRRNELDGHKGRYKICTKEGCRKPRAFAGFCAEHSGKAAPAEAAA